MCVCEWAGSYTSSSQGRHPLADLVALALPMYGCNAEGGGDGSLIETELRDMCGIDTKGPLPVTGTGRTPRAWAEGLGSRRGSIWAEETLSKKRKGKRTRRDHVGIGPSTATQVRAYSLIGTNLSRHFWPRGLDEISWSDISIMESVIEGSGIVVRLE